MYVTQIHSIRQEDLPHIFPRNHHFRNDLLSFCIHYPWWKVCIIEIVILLYIICHFSLTSLHVWFSSNFFIFIFCWDGWRDLNHTLSHFKKAFIWMNSMILKSFRRISKRLSSYTLSCFGFLLLEHIFLTVNFLILVSVAVWIGRLCPKSSNPDPFWIIVFHHCISVLSHFTPRSKKKPGHSFNTLLRNLLN